MKLTPPHLILLLLIGVFLAQDHPLQAQAQPDCSWTATFTGDGNTTSHANLSSSNTPCVSWRITYSATGSLASVIAFQTSPDNSSFTSVPNSICSSSVQPPCVTEGANPTASASVGNVAVRAYSAYTRVNVSGSSGSGTGSIAVYGYKGTSVNVLAAGSGGGGTVSSPGMTVNTIPKATAAQTIANSLLTDISSVLTYTGRVNSTANFGAGLGVYGMAATVGGALDTGLSRDGANIIDVGNGTALDATGTIKATTGRFLGNALARGAPSASFGYAQLISAADATHVGNVEWGLGNNTVLGSMGAADTSNITLTLQNSAKFVMTGGFVGNGIVPTIQSQIASNTAPISGGFGTLTNSALRVQTENASTGGTAAELQLGGRSASGTLPIAALSAILETNSTGTGQIGALVFSTHAAVGDAALTERMRILANGTIGIGTAATSTTSSSLTLASNLAIGPAILGMASATTGAFDLGLSRVSAGVLGIGTGAAAATDGAYSTGVGTHTINAGGTVITDGVVIQNTTAAAAGAQQFSPRLRLSGQVWKTTGSATQQIDWEMFTRGAQGTAATGQLYITGQVAGGGYSTTGGLLLQTGASTTVPWLGFGGTNAAGSGLGGNTANTWNFVINSVDSVGYAASKVAHASTMEVGWAAGAPGNTSAMDTGFARNAAGTVEVNGGTIGTIAGGLFSREYGSGGTVPGISGCTAGTQTGGGTVGTFASGTTGVCTVTLTFAKTAPTGWYCIADNQTTFSAFANIFTQTGGTTTTCVLSATTVSGDVVKFAAFYY